MRTDSFIALKIGQNPHASDGSLQPLLERSLGILTEALDTVDSEAVRVELGGRVGELRAALAAGTDPHHLGELTQVCFDMYEQTLHALQTQQHERRSELRRLVALVRDTVTMLVGDGESFSSDISQAATRFNALLQLNDVQQLKHQLMAQVGDLQRIATERKQQWQQTVKMFEARIVTLEKQLIAVKHEAALDPLTGVANRRHFEQTLRGILQSSQREVIVAIFDLDGFKAVNDTGGHAAGDAVLQAVAQTLKTSVRKDDLVARIGGDEFALISSGLTLRDAEPRVRTIVTALAAMPTGLDQPPRVTVSCGLAEYCAGDTVESLQRRADQALYDAKRHGKNRVVVKSPPFIRDLLRRP
jgi:diguanylate cyclase